MAIKRKPNSYDIASQAGVSQTTVSFVLNGRTDVVISAATRERVLQAARDMGYRPNRSARAIQSGRFGCVALLGSTVAPRSVLPSMLRDGILDALAEHDLHLILTRLSDSALTDEQFVPTILREWTADGLLVNYNADVPAAMETLLEENHLPSIWLNARRAADCVYPDDYGAGRQATEVLLDAGHRRITFFNYTGVTHYSAVDRSGGYADAMTARGLAPHIVYPAEGSGVGSLSEMAALLQRPDRSTGFITYSPSTAATLMYAAVLQGLRVPRDLSLITFHEHVWNAIGQGIDTMILPEYDMGRVAVEMLLKKIEDPAAALPAHPLPCPHGRGETLAPPPPS